MEATKNNRKLYAFFGIVLLTQAVTSLIGGTIFMGAFDSVEMNDTLFRSIADNTANAYASIMLQIVTAIVIIMLGIAMYRIIYKQNIVMADIALSMYVLEAVLLAVGQAFYICVTKGC